MKTLQHKSYVVLFYLLLAFNVRAQNDSLRIDSLRKVLLIEKDDTNKVNTLNDLNETLYETHDYKAAIQEGEMTLELSQQINFKKGESEALLLMGYNYYVNNNYSEAIKYGLQALKIKEDLKDIRGRAIAHDLLDASYGMQGNYSENLRHAFAAVKLWEEIGDTVQTATGLSDLGNIYISHDNYIEGYKYAQRALDISRKAGDKRLIASCLTIIAEADLKTGKLNSALQNLFDAMTIWRNLGKEYVRFYAGDNYMDIGDIYKTQGESALDSGYQTKAMKKFGQAKDNYDQALKYYIKSNNTSFIGMAYINLGEIAIKYKNIEEAKKYFEKGIETAKSTGFKLAIRDGYSKLSQLDSIMGNYQQAYIDYKNYIVYRDSLNNEEDAKKAVQVQMQYDFDKKESIAKAQQDKKDADAKRIKNQQFFAIAALGIVVLAVIIIAFIQFRNNKQKQKANILLERQKQKVEIALSELKSTQAQLIQSEKMASLGELTAGIAHEIQNPLNFVNNFSEVNQEMIEELLSEKLKVRSERNEELENEILNDIKVNEEKINHHGKRADAIVKGMLQHSRKNTGQKEPTDINALCDEYLRLSYHGLRAKDKNFNADFKTDFDEAIGKINIVPQDIGRVLLNLFNNAFYAVNEKKKLMANSYQPIAKVSTRKLNNVIEIRVEDNGDGIPQNIIDKIFQPFFTTKPTGEGTGLGLSLSYDIITKEHNGTIKVESKEASLNDTVGSGEGTAFIINLPIV